MLLTRCILHSLMPSVLCCSLHAKEEPVTWAEIQALQGKIAILKQQLERQTHSRAAPSSISHPTPLASAQPKNNTVLFSYATIRPIVGVINTPSGSRWQVRDSLSYIGFKAIHSFAASWSAQLHGEWRFDTADENNIASARRAYTAISSPFGRLTIGKQRSVSYQFIADYIEMFNYSSNPLTYPPDTDFFIDNFVTYSDKYGPFSWIAGAKFNGSNDDKQSDLVNIGVSYDKKGLHAGVSYLSKERYSNAQLLGQDTAWAGTFVYQFHPRIYGALFYQAKRYQRTPEAADRNGFTADLSLSYQIMEHYKLTTRVIAFDNDFAHADVRNQAYTGHALTLEWQPSRPIRIHIEYLNKDFDNQPDINAISIGLRYDFRHRLQLK